MLRVERRFRAAWHASSFEVEYGFPEVNGLLMSEPLFRVATVSLNPAIDQTANVANFTEGAVNRVARERSDAGGKAVNVASFLAHTGHSVAVTGFLGTDNAGPFERLFVESRIVDRFVRLPGSTRVNVKIVDDAQERVTDINFPGLRPGARDLAALTAAIDELAETAEWFALSGSVPTCRGNLHLHQSGSAQPKSSAALAGRHGEECPRQSALANQCDRAHRHQRGAPATRGIA